MKLYRGDGRFYLVPDDVALDGGDVAIVALDGRTVRASATQLAPFRVTESVARRFTAQTMGDFVQGLSQITRNMTRAMGALDEQLPTGDAPLPAVSALLADLDELLTDADLTRPDVRKKIDDRVAAMKRYGEVARLEEALGEAQQSSAELIGELLTPVAPSPDDGEPG